MSNIKQRLESGIKLCTLALFAGCIATNSYALNGPTVISDCGQQKVQPGDDYSLLIYQPGDLPSPTLCKYPNVGAFFSTSSAVNLPGPNRLLRNCSGSLIHIDSSKAVYLLAGHCFISSPPPHYITFEPQPVTPYAPRIDGRDVALTNVNTFLASGTLIHPLYDNLLGNSFDLALLIFDNSNGQFSNLNVTPLTIPNAPLYLDTLKGNQLNQLTWTGVGYAGFERPLGNNPDATVPNNFKERQLAQHNRTYASLDFYRFGKNAFGPGNFILVNQQTNAGRDGVCNGDSGGPLIINNNTVIGVASFVSGVNGNPTPGFCDLKAAYSRTDLPENYNFIKCAIDPGKSLAEALLCPHR